jgi:hypothetical protein
VVAGANGGVVGGILLPLARWFVGSVLLGWIVGWCAGLVTELSLYGFAWRDIRGDNSAALATRSERFPLRERRALRRLVSALIAGQNRLRALPATPVWNREVFSTSKGTPKGKWL